MGAPQIPLDVDDVTGWWIADALPMILVPQHFLVNNHKAMEAALGLEAYRAALDEAGARSAYHWCATEAAHYKLGPEDVLRFYLERLSQRGWGRFALEALDAAQGRAHVRVEHSSFVNQYRHDAGRKVCYMFGGWWEGALRYVGDTLGQRYRPRASEVHCAAEGVRDHCLFEVKPA